MAINNQRGQSVVEYILLLAVVVSIVVTFYNSQTFKNLFGDNGAVGMAYKWESEWGYRHGFIKGKTPGETNLPYNSAEAHPSYYNSSLGRNRFFGASDPYP